MSFSEHVEVLNMMLKVSTTVDDWNEWRSENPSVIPLLREVDLRGKKLMGLDLSKADLCGAQLSGANLIGANLTEADLSKASLRRTNLTGAFMAKANLAMSDLTRAKLIRAELHEANMSNAILGEADLSEAHMLRVNLTGANLCRANLSGANLRRAYLRDAVLLQANMNYTVLTGANFDRARLKGARFLSRSMLNLVNTILTDKQLAEAIFEDEVTLHKEKAYLPLDAPADKIHFIFEGDSPFTPLELGFLLTGIQISYNRFDYLRSTEDIDIKRINHVATTTPCYVGVDRDIQVRSITRGSWIIELTRLINEIPPEVFNMGVLLGFGKFAQQITTAIRNMREATKLKEEAEKLKAEAEKLKAEGDRLRAYSESDGRGNGLNSPSMLSAVCINNTPITTEEQTELFSAVQCDPEVRRAAVEALAANPGLSQHPDILIESSRPLQLGIYNAIKNGERGVLVTIIPTMEKEAEVRK